jgi:hypothetical protein
VLLDFELAVGFIGLSSLQTARRLICFERRESIALKGLFRISLVALWPLVLGDGTLRNR